MGLLPRLCSPILLLLFLLRLVLSASPANDSLPTPLIFPPSTIWDGNDGAWSSFAIQIGSPPQIVRLLPSTTGNSIWTVVYPGCDESDGDDCSDSRGSLFAMNKSTTWRERGTYALPLSPQHYLPYSGNGFIGLDNITLNWPGSDNIRLGNQVIVGYADTDFHVGNLGLSPKTFNIDSLYDAHSSLIGTLREQSRIPSMSYSYSAGANYYSYPRSSFASLVFGGLDLTRFNDSHGLTLAGGSDQYRPMLLGIESITSDNRVLLDEPIIAALDSQVTQIWLPVSACQAFEDAFGLVWNETSNLYLLNSTQHDALVQRDPSVTFVLSTGLEDSTDRLNISLPYGAFDLIMKPPLAGAESTRYFPLRRAANSSQVTLGRTFFQELYLVADYDRGAINLYPVIYPQSSVKPNIVPICHPSFSTCNAASPDNTPGLSPGLIAGIAVGVVSLIAAIAMAIFVTRRRRKNRALGTGESETAPVVSKEELPVLPELSDTHALPVYIKSAPPIGYIRELHGVELNELNHTSSSLQEIRGTERHQMATRDNIHELSGSEQHASPSGDRTRVLGSELPP